jgi:hypothetical protein
MWAFVGNSGSRCVCVCVRARARACVRAASVRPCQQWLQMNLIKGASLRGLIFNLINTIMGARSRPQRLSKRP